MFMNGDPYTTFAYQEAPLDPKDPDIGDPRRTWIKFPSGVPFASRITFAVIGPSYDDNLNPINYSWSSYVASEFPAVGGVSYPVAANCAGTNSANFIAYVNGYRVEGPSTSYRSGDSVRTTFLLPNRFGFSQSAIANGDVTVWVEGVLQTQGVDYVVDPYVAPELRTITFTVAPPQTTDILISVTTGAQVRMSGNFVTFATAPAAGSTIKVITWNDTRQAGISTKVFTGPFYAANEFHLDRRVYAPSKMIVTLNGLQLSYGDGFMTDFETDCTEIELADTIGPTDVLCVTMFANDEVVQPENWHIFTDMRGVQAVYRMPENEIAELLMDVTQEEDNVIYLKDASTMPTPQLIDGIHWGVVMIGSERL